MAMPAKQGLRSRSIEVGEDFVQLPAGIYDLVALSPSGQHCARRVILVSAGDFTHLYTAKGVDRPMLGLPANYLHEADTSFVEATQSIVVYY